LEFPRQDLEEFRRLLRHACPAPLRIAESASGGETASGVAAEEAFSGFAAAGSEDEGIGRPAQMG